MGKYICAEVIHEIVKRARWNNEIAKETALCIIKEAEPADVELVVHAHWEMVEERKYDGVSEVYRTGKLIPMCTHCRNAMADFKNCFSYCPECGARMDEVVTNG